MKKILIFAAFAIVAFAGCVKNDVVAVVENDVQITYQVVTGNLSTKVWADGDGIIDDTTYPTGETFGSAAFYNKNGGDLTMSDENYIPMSEVKYYTPYWAVYGDDTSHLPYYWPKEGSLTFFSFSPWDELHANTTIGVEYGVKITGWDVDAKQKVDVMVADVKTNQTKNTAASPDGVPTVFRHKLAQIQEFKFKTDATNYQGTPNKVGSIQFFVDKIEIKEIFQKGDYTSTNIVGESILGSWAVDATAGLKSYVWYSAAGGTEFTNEGTGKVIGVSTTGTDANQIKNNYLLVLPQPFNAEFNGLAGISIDYRIRHWWGTENNNYTDEKITVFKSFSEIYGGSAPQWEMNHIYNFVITIGSQSNQIYWHPIVKDWSSTTSTGVTF